MLSSDVSALASVWRLHWMMETVGWEGLGVSVECLLQLWFFWTRIKVILAGKANCCMLQSQDLLLQQQLYNHLGMFIIVFQM